MSWEGSPCIRSGMMDVRLNSSTLLRASEVKIDVCRGSQDADASIPVNQAGDML